MDIMKILLEVALPLTLFFIMFGMGMTLTVQDFVRLKDYPRAIFGGLLGQLVILPIVGGVLAILWGLRPEFAIGMIILAACPGGTTSNIVSYLAKGDRPLSITLTAVNSCIVVFTIPLYAALAVEYFAGGTSGTVEMPLSQIIFSVFVYTLVPVGAGMILHHYAPKFSTRVGPYYDRVAAIAFTLIVLLIIWNGQGDLKTILPLVGGVTITLNVVMTAIGFGLAYLLSLNHKQAVTLGIEVGIQNTVLGMAVATLLHGVHGLDARLMVVPCAVYGLIMYGPAIGMILMGRRGHKRSEVSVPVKQTHS